MKKLAYIAILACLLTSCYYRPKTPRGSFALGSDIGWLSEMENDSVKFYSPDGQPDDCLDIMQSMGMNAVRLRVWVNHSTGWSNKDDVVRMAKRAAKQGLRVMIDFHYSDFFADPHSQTIPVAWQNYNYNQLREAVFEHTLDVLYALKEAGVKPEWVQIGNETPNGMLWPVGKVGENLDDKKLEAERWDHYAGFTAAGYKAAKEAFSDINVIVHVDNAYQYRDWFFDQLIEHGGQFDMIGLSHYPMMRAWSGLDWQEMNQLAEQNIQKLIDRYHRPVMIAEIGMMNSQWPDYQSVSALADTVMTDFLNRIAPIDSCVGVFYWEPEVYGDWRPAEYIPLGWGSYNMGAFTPEGQPAPSLHTLFKFSKQ